MSMCAVAPDALGLPDKKHPIAAEHGTKKPPGGSASTKCDAGEGVALVAAVEVHDRGASPWMSLIGHGRLSSPVDGTAGTVRYLGIEVDDALSISEQVEL